MRAVLRRLRREYPEARTALDHSSPWELLVATILSAQTTDAQVNEVTPALFARWPGPEELAAADEREVVKVIFATGFHNQKARSIIGTARAVAERHGGRVPRRMEQMVQLPGVGRKTASVVLGNAYGSQQGIAVDTHVGRLVRRLGFTTEEDPVKVERVLLGLVPRASLDALHPPVHRPRPGRLHGALAALRRLRPALALPLGQAPGGGSGGTPGRSEGRIGPRTRSVAGFGR